jgi:lipopolysaccharide transport system permease protein
VLSHLVDFTISLLLLVAVMAYYGVIPGSNIVFLPFFMLMMIGVPIAVGLWLSSLAIRFRDVRFAMGFVIKMLIYSAPILYSASQIPDEYRIWYSLNPIVGVVEGFRACLLGTEIPWMFVFPGFLMLIFFLATGAMYFRRMERVIVDVI